MGKILLVLCLLFAVYSVAVYRYSDPSPAAKISEPAGLVLVEQLEIGGKMVIPIGLDQKSQVLIRIIRTEKGYTTENFGPCAFVPLIGNHGWRGENEK